MQILRPLRDLRQVLLALVFLLIFFTLLSPPQDADMWWHLAAGKKMVEQGRFLTTDTFSYTHGGDPWTNAFWLSDIFLFMTYRLAGYMGIALLVSVVAVITMAILYRQTADAPFPIPHLVLLLGALAIAPVWTARPQIFSFLLLAILGYGLNSSNRFFLKRPWLLIGLFILWANIHGGFIWGFLLLLAFIVGKGIDYSLKRENSLPLRTLGTLGLWTLLGALAILINPNGIALWKLPFYTVDVSLQSISEWSSPDFHRIDLHPLLWLLFLLIVGIGTSKKALGWGSLLSVIGFAYMAFVSQRSIGPFVVVTVPVAIQSLSWVWEEWMAILPGIRKPSTSGNVSPVFAILLHIVLLGMVAGLVLFRAYSVSTAEQVHRGLPRNAVEAIRANPPAAQMFNSYNWGGYLQWELPEYPVFIDGRADLYGEQTIEDWWSVVNATDRGLKLLDTWQINFVVLEPGWPVLQRLSQMGWQTLYEDETAVVLKR